MIKDLVRTWFEGHLFVFSFFEGGLCMSGWGKVVLLALQL